MNRKDCMGNQAERKGRLKKRKRKQRYLKSHCEAKQGNSEKEETDGRVAEA